MTVWPHYHTGSGASPFLSIHHLTSTGAHVPCTYYKSAKNAITSRSSMYVPVHVVHVDLHIINQQRMYVHVHVVHVDLLDLAVAFFADL